MLYLRGHTDDRCRAKELDDRDLLANDYLDTRMQLLASVESGKAAVVEIQVDEDFEPVELKDLPRVEGSIVVAVTRGEETLVPHGNDIIKPGDRLLVFATDVARDKVRKLF